MQVKANNCNLQIKKVDKETNKPVANVTFEIKNKEGKKIGEAVTGKDGIARINDITPQIVKIKEIKVPEEYVLSKDEKEIMLEWGKTAQVFFENRKKKGQIEIYKVDKENNKIKLEGVEFNVLDNKNNIVDTLKTNDEGYAITKKLPIGEYTIVETKTKNEYILNEEKQTIEIVEDGEVVKLIITNLLKEQPEEPKQPKKPEPLKPTLPRTGF